MLNYFERPAGNLPLLLEQLSCVEDPLAPQRPRLRVMTGGHLLSYTIPFIYLCTCDKKAAL